MIIERYFYNGLNIFGYYFKGSRQNIKCNINDKTVKV